MKAPGCPEKSPVAPVSVEAVHELIKRREHDGGGQNGGTAFSRCQDPLTQQLRQDFLISQRPRCRARRHHFGNNPASVSDGCNLPARKPLLHHGCCDFDELGRLAYAHVDGCGGHFGVDGFQHVGDTFHALDGEDTGAGVGFAGFAEGCQI
jgi:hypothetical protein